MSARAKSISFDLELIHLRPHSHGRV